jgi:hypothetical protein
MDAASQVGGVVERRSRRDQLRKEGVAVAASGRRSSNDIAAMSRRSSSSASSKLLAVRTIRSIMRTSMASRPSGTKELLPEDPAWKA